MVIRVQCPECATSFPVDPAKIPVGGVKVRCSACSSIFRVERPEEAAPPPAPPPEPQAVAEPEPVPIAEPEPEVSAEPEPEASAESEEEPQFEVPVFEEPVFGAPEAPEEAPDDAVSERYASETDFSVGIEAPGAEAPASPDEWVFETEQEIDAGSLDIEPVGTVQESMTQARDEDMDFGADGTFETNEMGTAVEEAPAEPEPVEEAATPGEEPVVAQEPETSTQPPPAPPTPQPITGFTFGKRDPHDKARRLARVLVSDIITYNPDRHQRALAGGTLKADFEDEIGKSWKEYVEQVGADIAGSTTYWTDALNQVLARGEQIF